MIKKTIVCDRCGKGKPWVIIPKSDKLASNTVLCKECANYYYAITCNIRCVNCGEQIAAGTVCTGTVCRTRFGAFCSQLCAIQYCEGHNGDDEQKARYFTDSDEKMLLGEKEEED